MRRVEPGRISSPTSRVRLITTPSLGARRVHSSREVLARSTVFSARLTDEAPTATALLATATPRVAARICSSMPSTTLWALSTCRWEVTEEAKRLRARSRSLRAKSSFTRSGEREARA